MYRSHEDGMTASFPGDKEFIHLNCLLDGYFDAHIKDTPLNHKAGQITMGYSDGEVFHVHNTPAFSNLAVMIRPEIFSQITDEETAEIDLSRSMAFFVRNAGQNQKATQSARQIAHLLAQDKPSKLLLHSAVLDFIHWHLSAFKVSKALPGSLSSREKQQLSMARDILLQDLSQPPTIAQVADTIGMNQCKLKKGFRTLFGNSLYAYFQQVRMEEARRLLQDYNVTETAMQLGYSNVSHFSNAFRKQFSILPGDARKEIKGQ